MPESVTDRPTKSHEQVFLLTKRPRYWFDAEAVREPAEYGYRSNFRGGGGYLNQDSGHGNGTKNAESSTTSGADPSAGRNIRSVWQIATQPYPEAHFATFPEELARRCILAGCPIRVCRVCGKPSERIVNTSYEKSPVHGTGSVVGRHYETGANNFDGAGMPRLNKVTETVGWSDCGCDHGCRCGYEDVDDGAVVRRNWFHEPGCNGSNWRPGIVLDPFIGSGTTAKVARDHQRHAIGIDLNQTYLELAARRLQQLSLLTETQA